MKSFVLGFVFAITFLAIVGLSILKLGLYPVNADTDPTWLEKKLAKMAVNSYVEKAAGSVSQNPHAPTEAVLMEGMKAFKSNCAGCHGSPSDKEGLFGKSFFPKAPQFGTRGLDDDEREVFWITKHGIRMSGMPGFGSMLKDDEIWKIVNFIGNAEKLPAAVQAEWEAN